MLADKRRTWGLALLAAAGYGLLAGWWTPRGPLSTFEGLSAMGLGLLVGLVAGLLLRTRWAMLVAPLTFAAIVELARLRATGPTVDGIHLGSTYGIMAFAVGRGVHGLLALLPMVLGAASGAALARRQDPPARPRRGLLSALGLWLRRGVAVATGLVLVALAALVARPASTDPIVDADGQPVAGSVAELTRVDIGGQDLALMIRGRSAQNPVLLFLAGGPGGSELGAMRRHSQSLEEDFVVVTLEVTHYLRDRFGRDKVYLAGQSWGTLLRVLAVQRDPDLFSAFISVGQMVSPAATDRIFYRDTLAWARESGNTDLVDTLTENGPPPYTSMLDYEPALSYEQEVYPYSHAGNSEGAGQMGENIFVGEYTLLEQLHVFGGFLETFSVSTRRSRTSTSEARPPPSTCRSTWLRVPTRHRGGAGRAGQGVVRPARGAEQAARHLRHLRAPPAVGAAHPVPRPDDQGPGRDHTDPLSPSVARQRQRSRPCSRTHPALDEYRQRHQPGALLTIAEAAAYLAITKATL